MSVDSKEQGYKKWAAFLWPIGGTILGLVAMPVAIAQYPELFNENRWSLPVSIAAGGLCWVVPLFRHQRAKRLYDWVFSFGTIGRLLCLVVVLILVVAVGFGSRALFRTHVRHLDEALRKNSPQPKEKPKEPEPVKPVPSEPPPIKPQHIHKPPLRQVKLVSTAIPFALETHDIWGFQSAGMPIPDIRKMQTNNPIASTWLVLEQFCKMKLQQDSASQNIRPSPQEITTFLIHGLRYDLLRVFVDDEHPLSSISYEQGRGITATTPPLILPPDAKSYPKAKVEEILKQSVFGVDIQQQYYWEHYGINALQVPPGSKFELTDNSVRISKTGQFILELSVEPSGENQGVLPVGFTTLPTSPSTKRELFTYMFRIRMAFEWDGPYEDAEPYKDWATALFSDIETRFTIPPL